LRFSWLFGLGIGDILLLERRLLLCGFDVLGLFEDFDPVVHRTGKEVEDELNAGDHGVFVDFERKDLVKIVRVELFVLVLVPNPYFGITALEITLLFFSLVGFRFLRGRLSHLRKDASQCEFIHMSIYLVNFYVILIELINSLI
jgi:hypothetical protein